MGNSNRYYSIPTLFDSTTTTITTSHPLGGFAWPVRRIGNFLRSQGLTMERADFTPGELRETVDRLFEVSDREICRILSLYLKGETNNDNRVSEPSA